jgi:hypothetical protein
MNIMFLLVSIFSLSMLETLLEMLTSSAYCAFAIGIVPGVKDISIRVADINRNCIPIIKLFNELSFDPMTASKHSS